MPAAPPVSTATGPLLPLADSVAVQLLQTRGCTADSTPPGLGMRVAL